MLNPIRHRTAKYDSNVKRTCLFFAGCRKKNIYIIIYICVWILGLVSIICFGLFRYIIYIALYSTTYPLVNIHKTMGNHIFLIEKSTISMAIFKRANCKKLPEGIPKSPDVGEILGSLNPMISEKSPGSPCYLLCIYLVHSRDIPIYILISMYVYIYIFPQQTKNHTYLYIYNMFMYIFIHVYVYSHNIEIYLYTCM